MKEGNGLSSYSVGLVLRATVASWTPVLRNNRAGKRRCLFACHFLRAGGVGFLEVPGLIF